MKEIPKFETVKFVTEAAGVLWNAAFWKAKVRLLTLFALSCNSALPVSAAVMCVESASMSTAFRLFGK